MGAKEWLGTGRGYSANDVLNRAHRESWDNRREIPFKAHLCGYPSCLRLLPLRSRAAVFHPSGPQTSACGVREGRAGRRGASEGDWRDGDEGS